MVRNYSRMITDPIFFEEAVNIAAYFHIFTEFLEELNETELAQGYFQHNGATCHVSQEGYKVFFLIKIISQNLRPLR